MKKTLIALAALAATGAFAQSSVTLSGVMDAGVKATSAATQANGTSKSNTMLTNNNVSTSQFDFSGSEDIGGGLKAGFFFELDINPTQSTTADAAVGNGAVFTGTPFNGQQYIGLNGKFGDVKLGTPNSGALIAGMAAQPFGTAMGSGYSAGFARLGVSGVGINQVFAGPSAGNRVVRHERTIAYTTPNFSGFTAGVEYSVGNDNSSTATSNSDTYTAANLAYSNGPLNVIYSYTNDKVGTNAVPTAWTITAAAPYTFVAPAATALLAPNTGITYNILAANYTFGATTVYAGMSNTKTDNANAAVGVVEDSNSWNIAAKYAATANIDLMGNYVVVQTNVTNARNAKMIGLGADYKLSKRTALYYRFEAVDTDTNLGTLVGGSVTNASAVGIKHAF